MSSLLTHDEEDFKILVATDIHLGYEEKNLTRADDSFNTFEEVLQLAVKHKVDFILLAGDLFHVNQPSVTSLERCISLLRTYCLGDKPINIEFLSDQAEIFKHSNHPIVNFEDQNLNVSIPVFSIHGNHDDPCGIREISCMDLLSSIGLINYFGKQTNLQDIKIAPILLKKGKNKIALYGLSHIRDERLERLFKDRKVRMLRPQEDVDEWFNIFVCHQNRFKRPGTKHLPENVIPSYMELTIWGHEHESLIDPVVRNPCGYISQPGSTVATSMCEAESGSKYVGLLTIRGKKFKIEPLELKTVRQMHFDTIRLSECAYDLSNPKKIQSFLKRKIKNILSDLSLKKSGHHKQPELPLIRLRIEYTSETQYFNTIQFGQTFQDSVANSNNMILLRMEKKNTEKKPRCIDDDALADIVDIEEVEKIEHIVEQYFTTASDGNRLELLSVNCMAEAVDNAVNKSRSDAINMVVAHQMKKVKNYVTKQEDLNENNILDYIADFHHTHAQRSKNVVNEVPKVLTTEAIIPRSAKNHDSSDEPYNSSILSDDELDNSSPNTGNRGSRNVSRRIASKSSTRGRRGRSSTTLNFLN